MTTLKQITKVSLMGASIVFSLGISGCGAQGASTSNNVAGKMANMSGTSMNLPTVTLHVPKQAKVGEPVQVLVHVALNGQAVNKVDDVKFEIWQDTPGAQHSITTASRTGDGDYSIHYTFRKAATYDVMYHVVAQGQMIMTGPVKVVVSQ